jgi:REP element-mobilizing transposase RayT
MISQATQATILATVVMDDHVHALVRPIAPETAGSLAQRWKSISSRCLVRIGQRRSPIWQAEYFDRWMESDKQTAACARYVLANPVRRWPGVGDYPWLIDGWSAPAP